MQKLMWLLLFALVPLAGCGGAKQNQQVTTPLPPGAEAPIPSAQQNNASQRYPNVPKLVGADGRFLGVLICDPNQIDYLDSIFDENGPYGSPYAANNIWNMFSPYGGAMGSDMAAYNIAATKPPILVIEEKFRYYVTKNTKLSPNVDPDNLRHLCAQQQ